MLWEKPRLHLAKLLAVSLLTLLLLASGFAQETRATLSGTVTDSSGLVVAGAKVRLAGQDTGVFFDTATNEVGHYRFLFLNPGA
jgi:hypothetical protein